MCTKCTLACRGGEECRFVSRLPRERRHAACVDVKRRLHGAWWRAPGGREGLVDTPPLLSIHYRLSGRRSYASPPSATLSLRSPYAYVPLWVLVTCVQCGFPPRHVCAAERRVLPYLPSLSTFDLRCGMLGRDCVGTPLTVRVLSFDAHSGGPCNTGPSHANGSPSGVPQMDRHRSPGACRKLAAIHVG